LSRPASLAEIDLTQAKKEDRFQGMTEAAKALAAPLMPQTELEQSQLNVNLANAGFRSDSALSVYLGIRFASLMPFAVLGMAILIQADRFGSSIAQALRVQSDSMRTRRRQIAEEKAAKTAVQLIFPLVLFIFPGIFVVLVGPAAISIMQTMFKN